MSKLLREETTTAGGIKAMLPQHQKKDGNFAVTGEVNPLPVQVTGTLVAHSTHTRPPGAMGQSLYLWDTKEAFIHDGVDWRAL